MKAKDFYYELLNKNNFAKLTGTDIAVRYKTVYEFAEKYSKYQMIEELNAVSQYISLDDKELMDYIDKRLEELKQ